MASPRFTNGEAEPDRVKVVVQWGVQTPDGEVERLGYVAGGGNYLSEEEYTKVRAEAKGGVAVSRSVRQRWVFGEWVPLS